MSASSQTAHRQAQARGKQARREAYEMFLPKAEIFPRFSIMTYVDRVFYRGVVSVSSCVMLANALRAFHAVEPSIIFP